MNDRRGFRRMQKQKKAVSPVVATLILILIAVAAAAALYLWLVSWQTGVTNGVGTPGAKATLTIGGSTSVYPFDSLAVTQFEQNNTDVAISNNQGGSGAGMLSVCAGSVDIGTASSLETVTQLEQPVASGGYGCQAFPTPTITTVAYDAVDVIVPVANTHGVISVSADTLLSIYVAGAGGTAAFTGSVPGGGVYAYHMNGLTGAAVAAPTGTGFTWNEVPACVPQVAAITCAGVAETATTVGAGGAACAGFPNDICSLAASPCGWTVCAGGANNVIQQWGRSDTSGTEQSFTARILGVGDAAGTTAGLGFSGCSPDGQLASCGINPSHLGNGNPAVISGVAGSADAIGFASDGLARATGSGVAFVPLAAEGQLGTGAVTPTTGGSGTIADGILGASTAANQYQGWRPFEFVTLGTPTGETEQFLQFVLDPANNQNFATESAEVSIYSI
jgi:phosphate transport system substrate-binding protein